MRSLLTGCMIAGSIMLFPVLAMAGNQETAEQIATSLRNSGRLGSEDRVNVKYQDGKAWLEGQVRSQDQYNLASRLASQSPGVKQVVNNLTVAPANGAANPLRGKGTPRMAMMQGPVAGQPAALPPGGGGPVPMYTQGVGGGVAPVRYDQPALPNYAWPSYAAHPNYAAVTYPKQYSPTAWPYIGPFYPYPQVPLGWRKVKLEWDDGWWMLDFKDESSCVWWK